MSRPYDDKGRFVPMACPRANCGGGRLVLGTIHGDPIWECDGLADPGDTGKPLEACTFSHFDGEAYQP